MRTIKKRPPPLALTQWRTPRLAKNRSAGMECTYEEMRRDPTTLEAVEDDLFHEQGGLCAYTGLQIRLEAGKPRKVDFHLEHLIPQDHCTYGQDAEYDNLVACWPKPNCGFEPVFGARKKGNWPPPEETHLFVSPLNKHCTERFSFNHRGEISPANQGDESAKQTIEKLGLDHKELTELRAEAIKGALGLPTGKIRPRPITLGQAQKLLRQIEEDCAKLDRGEPVRLRPFCFVLQQVLPRTIRKLEGIAKQKRARP